jgi:acyl-CoA reductase-like NAD-dependent aldehyde dehydrogenase
MKLPDDNQRVMIYNTQRVFYATGQTRSIAYRLEMLKKLKHLIASYEDKITAALQSDLGRSGYETFITENIVVFDELNAAIKNLKRWSAGEKVATPPQLFYGSSHILYEPLGLVLIISPWNFPFHLSFAPLVGALAAGNCCIIKPSELAPASSALIAEIINNNFPEGYVRVIEGGHEVTATLMKNRFDHVFFTGSTTNGREIYKLAAENLTPVTMELGGKCPCIVHEDAAIDIAVRRIVWGKFLNSGQTCLAPDYLLVHKSIKDKLVTALRETIQQFYGKEPLQNAEWPRMINRRHYERVMAFMQDGEVQTGGRGEPAKLVIEPTVLTRVGLNAPVMQQEIFGPVLPVLEYDTISEAIDIINRFPKPLAVYAFTGNKQVKQQLSQSTSSGALVFNECLMHGANGNLPFGGVGDSGIGRYHHQFSFKTFSNAKGVFDRSTWPDLQFRYPPYSSKSLNLMKKFI